MAFGLVRTKAGGQCRHLPHEERSGWRKVVVALAYKNACNLRAAKTRGQRCDPQAMSNKPSRVSAALFGHVVKAMG